MHLSALPVSAMLYFHHADQMLDVDGKLAPGWDITCWLPYAARGVEQLHWWAEAAALQRQRAEASQLPRGVDR